MSSVGKFIEKNHKLIFTLQGAVILLVLAACILHDIIPVCHYIFGCDHKMHLISSF